MLPMSERRLPAVLLVAALWAGAAGTAAAKMYKYTDRAGQDHYVDSQSKIPQEYREKQEEVQPIRNESSAVVPYTPRPAVPSPAGTAAVPGGPGKTEDPACARKRDQAQKDIAEYQKKAADWEKEHQAESAAKPEDSGAEKIAQIAVEKCLGGGGNIDPAKAMEAIQANANCISQVTKEEGSGSRAAAEKSDNPYLKRIKSAQEELDRLKTKCGG